MLNTKIKTIVSTLLILTVTISIIALQPVDAQSNFKQSYAVIMVEPDPVGIGQTMMIVLGISEPLPQAALGWEGLTVTITKPDNTTTTVGPYRTDSTGTTFASYVPTQTGTYQFQTNFPGMWLNTSSFNRYYQPSVSQKISIIVQEEPVSGANAAPLPTEYWTRPINTENREWWSLAGNWLMAYYDSATNAFNPYSEAPDTAHIMWTRQMDFGGIVGGNFSETAYYSGESYENKWDPPVVMNGRLYYNQRVGSSTWLGTACVELQTGQQIWFKENLTLSFGQILNFDSPNQHGAIAYLWSVSGTTMKMYDAFSGEWILDISNVPAGTTTFGASGEILKYRLYTQSGVQKLSLWNSSKVNGFMSLSYGEDSPMWRPPRGETLNGTTGIMWTKDVPSLTTNPSLTALFPDAIVAIAFSPQQNSRGRYTQETGWLHYGISLKPGQEGQLLWSKTREVTGNRTLMITGARGTVATEGIYTGLLKETKQYIGYDAYTGNQLWITEPVESDWAMYQMGGQTIAYGKFYTATYSGEINAYDIKTGETAWTYFSGSSGLATPYGQYPFCAGVTGSASVVSVADGKVYAVNNEHSPSMPLYKGYKMHVIDTETGEGVWSITGWYQHPVIADGIVLSLNAADNRIYSFGKGPSSMTVEAPISGVTLGSSVVIRGTVQDISAGTLQVASRFPNGVAAVSDESMSAWMEYVYMQMPRPTNTTGVEVSLSVIDANGNYRDIGTTISNSDGFFTFNWKPDIEGQYTVYASFDGSESYWSSHAVTAFAVDPAPATPAPTDAPAQSAADLYFVPAIAGLFAFVAIIGVVIILVLRKRP